MDASAFAHLAPQTPWIDRIRIKNLKILARQRSLCAVCGVRCGRCVGSATAATLKAEVSCRGLIDPLSSSSEREVLRVDCGPCVSNFASASVSFPSFPHSPLPASVVLPSPSSMFQDPGVPYPQAGFILHTPKDLPLQLHVLPLIATNS